MGARDDDKMVQDTLRMTRETIGRDLLEALVGEVRMLPDVWPKLPKAKQDDVIERLRKRVEAATTMAVHLINSGGRRTVLAVLEQCAATKNGIKATLVASPSRPESFDLFPLRGQDMLLVLGDANEVMGDTSAVKGEEDQRTMDLGNEYDPKGDGKGMEGAYQAGEVVDAEFKEVPALPHSVLQSELDQAYRDGWIAADRGIPKDACPNLRHELVAQWTQGWTDWQEGATPRVQIDAVPDAATPPGAAPLTPIDALQAAVDAENAGGDAGNSDSDTPQAGSDAAPAQADAEAPGAQDSAKPALKPSAKAKPAAKPAAAKKGGRK